MPTPDPLDLADKAHTVDPRRRQNNASVSVLTDAPAISPDTISADSDLDALIDAPEQPHGKECRTGWALQRIDPVTADKIRLVIARGITRERARIIVATFLQRGITVVGEQSVVRHAHGGCRNCADRSAAA